VIRGTFQRKNDGATLNVAIKRMRFNLEKVEIDFPAVVHPIFHS
jgi:hypothetical protein